MARKNGPEAFEEIERLVRDEVGRALEKFRAGDFEARVKRRIAAEAGPVRGRARIPARIAVPAAGAVVLALVTAGILFVARGRAPARGPIDAGLIAAALREMPPFDQAAPDGAPGRLPAAESQRSGGVIEGVLGSAPNRSGYEAGAGEAGAEAPKAPPLTMKKRMEILFKDKIIERVLLSCAPRSKEV